MYDKPLLHAVILSASLALAVLIAAPGKAPAQTPEPTGPVETIELPGDDAPIDAPDESTPEESTDESLIREKGPQFKFRGEVKNLYTFHRTDNFMGGDPLTLSSKNLSADLTRIRLAPEFLYGDILTLRLDLDNELIWSNYGKSGDFTNYWRPSGYNDFLDLTWEPFRGHDLMYRIKIHRAYIKLSVEGFTASFGKQQIRFGSGKLWNPLDILNPISPTFVEGGDEQKGTDALKLDFYPDETTEITAVIDFKKSNDQIEHFNLQDQNYIARIKTSVRDADIAVLGGYVSRRGVAGFDFAAILFDGMLRGAVLVSQANESYITEDSSWYRLEYLLPGRDGKGSIFFQANAGYEYTFKAGVFLLVEYFYNQKGLNYQKDMKAASITAQFNAMDQKTYMMLSNSPLTLNQHYVAAAIGYDFHPLVRGEFFTIGDIQGRGIFWSPLLRVNAMENLDFSVGMMGAFVFDNRASDFSEFRKNYLFYASGSYVF
ncbi:MAG: hypothetical protein E4G96_06175 [Chrysiogenales bacterium]|nr:MAG: hypothetical protein E4G96_06175 [Chrysiogenales bacterium]